MGVSLRKVVSQRAVRVSYHRGAHDLPVSVWAAPPSNGGRRRGRSGSHGGGWLGLADAGRQLLLRAADRLVGGVDSLFTSGGVLAHTSSLLLRLTESIEPRLGNVIRQALLFRADEVGQRQLGGRTDRRGHAIARVQRVPPARQLNFPHLRVISFARAIHGFLCRPAASSFANGSRGAAS
jgi:hypothetical protein